MQEEVRKRSSRNECIWHTESGPNPDPISGMSFLPKDRQKSSAAAAAAAALHGDQ